MDLERLRSILRVFLCKSGIQILPKEILRNSFTTSMPRFPVIRRSERILIPVWRGNFWRPDDRRWNNNIHSSISFKNSYRRSEQRDVIDDVTSRTASSVTGLADFWKSFNTKVAVTLTDFLAFLKNKSVKVKVIAILFGQLKGKNWLLLITTYGHTDSFKDWHRQNVELLNS